MIGDVVVLQFESIDEVHKHGQNLADMGPVEGSDLNAIMPQGQRILPKTNSVMR